MSETDSVFIHLKEKVVKLTFRDFDDEIDADELTSINYSNLYGEAVTVSALMNKIGLFKAEAEAEYEAGKLELSIYEAERRKELRREAAANSGKIKISEDETLKLTEKALDEVITLDKGWQVKKKNVAKRKKDLDFVDALFWSINSKDKKLNNLMPSAVPEDFESEIVAGKINGIMIQTKKKQYSK